MQLAVAGLSGVTGRRCSGVEVDMKDIEEIFDVDEPTEVDKTTGEVETKDEPEEKPEVEAPEEKAEEEPKAASPAAEDENKVPISAMHGERDRRKAAERERDEFKAQLADSKKADPTSVFEDEGKFRTELHDDLNQALNNQSLNQSEFFVAREIGRDKLDQKIETFRTLAENNPEIRQRFSNAVSPYHELIDIVDQHDEMDKMKDLDGYKATLKAEVKAELKAELEAEVKAKAELRDSVPDSLVDEIGKGALDSKPTSFKPKTAEEVFDTSP